jgi:hypothetical protein
MVRREERYGRRARTAKRRREPHTRDRPPTEGYPSQRSAHDIPTTSAPAAPAAVPPTPKGLSVASRALWREFHRQYDLVSAPALELLESALRSRDVAEQARATLEREGLTFADSTGRPKAHPAAAIQRDARAVYVSTLRVVGGLSVGEAD